jgi:hypothetical protein
MTTVTIKINERSKKGQAFIEFLNQFIKGDKAVEIIKTPNAETLKAIKHVEDGKTIKTKGVKDFMKQMNS